MQIQFDDITLNVRPHPLHEWALTTAEVAEGYGVSPEAIRSHKSRNAEEFTEGKHFVSVANRNAVGNQADTYWTKRGVVRLGFFIKSDRARLFRDWAEDLVIQAAESAPAPAPYYLPQTKAEALRALAEEIEAHEATQLQLQAAQPKVEHYERTMNAEGFYTVAEAAKMIGTGQNRLFEFLRQHNVLFHHRGHNQPYQQYVDSEWFSVRQRTYKHGDREESYPQLFVTPKGVEAIRKKWDAASRSTATAYLPALGGQA